MSLKTRLDKLESLTYKVVQTTKPLPAISKDAWMVLFADGGPGWNVKYEQLVEWSVQNGYQAADVIM